MRHSETQANFWNTRRYRRRGFLKVTIDIFVYLPEVSLCALSIVSEVMRSFALLAGKPRIIDLFISPRHTKATM